jgi:hypothetical protein
MKIKSYLTFLDFNKVGKEYYTESASNFQICVSDILHSSFVLIIIYMQVEINY